MSLHLTNRLVTAVLVSITGVLVAVLGGRAEAAVVTTPWLVLLVLGLAGDRRGPVTAQLRVDRDRVMIGDPVELEVAVGGLRGGWVEAIWQPPIALTQPARSIGRTGGTGEGRAATDGTDGTATADTTGAGGTATLRCHLHPPAWGTHDVGRVELRVHHPFGLLIERGQARRSLPIRVHPQPVDLRRLLAPWHVRRLSGVHRSRAAARGVEYVDIRPYGPGDSRRDINWRASARSTELLVSQRHPDRSTHAILLVDTFTDSGLDPTAVLGQSIEAALALAESHLSASDRVGLIDLGGVVRWVVPGSGRHHLQRLVDALLSTRLHRSEAERPVTSVPTRALPPRSFVLALSPLLDRRFVDALFTLRAAGHDLSVIEFVPPVDPDAPRWHRTEVASLAVRLWQAERDALRDRLAEQGVAVARRRLDTSPDQREPWDRTLLQLAGARRRTGPPMRA